ncbi:MAG: DUF72 domain-containing protein, partial [Acetobacteraceae bacterium]|nr:DUF72 domain-containing protein [Acetobacteraceae bacterium]
AQAELDRWAERLTALAQGRALDGVSLLAEPSEPTPRDVFAYVISGHKERNPAAAMALLQRVAG